jgi:hypothetical protein
MTTRPDIDTYRLIFNRVASGDFRAALLQAIETSEYHRENIDLKSSYDDYECWMPPTPISGFAVSKNHELVNVFSGVCGVGSSAVKCAQEHYDYLHLNCYDTTFLKNFYLKNDFKIVDVVPSYIPGKRDVLFMEWHKN